LEDIKEFDQNIKDALLDEDVAEHVYSAECISIEEYEDKSMAAFSAVELIMPPPNIPAPSKYSTAVSGSERKRTYKIPKFEIKKFYGDVIGWLSSWNQFQRNHIDQDLHDADKFQFLSQAMSRKSKAEELIRVHPQTPAYYPKAIKALQ